jgi:hypothetical protein
MSEKIINNNARVDWFICLIRMLFIAAIVYVVYFICGGIEMCPYGSAKDLIERNAYFVVISLISMRMIVGMIIGEKSKKALIYVFLPVLMVFISHLIRINTHYIK